MVVKFPWIRTQGKCHLFALESGTGVSTTVCAEMFARRNFRELRAELKFRIFIFANDCLIIYISYIANLLVLMFTMLSMQEDGGIAVCFCELRARIPCVSRDLDCNGGRNADLRTNDFT